MTEEIEKNKNFELALTNQINLFEKHSKILDVLGSVIENIETKDNVVFIKTKKDIVIVNDGNNIVINSGVSVNISKEIHLNPKINIDNIFEDVNNIENILDEAKEFEKAKILEELSK